MRSNHFVVSLLLALGCGVAWLLLSQGRGPTGGANLIPSTGDGTVQERRFVNLEAAGAERAPREAEWAEGPSTAPQIQVAVTDGEGAPVRGVLFQVVDAEGEIREEGRSDRGGSWSAKAGGGARRLSVRPNAVFLEHPGIALTPSQAEGRERVEVRVRRARRGLVRGIAVDVRGEPVPWLKLAFFDAADIDDEVRTDGQGRFALTERMREGPLRIHSEEWLGHPFQASLQVAAGGEIDPEWPFGEWRLVVPAGPTYRLCLSGEGSESELTGWLAGASSLGHDLDRALFAPVQRDEGTAWVRFRHSRAQQGQTLRPAGPPYQLWVGSLRAGYLGGAAVGDAPRDCVSIRLQPRHQVSVRVVDPSGRPVPEAEVRWLGSDGRPIAVQRLPEDLTYVTDAQATFSGVPPGPMRLDVVRGGWLRQSVDVEVPCGLVDVVLERRADLGSVTGELRFEAGPSRAVSLGLRHESASGSWICTTQPSGGLEESRIHRFAFEDVPAGSCSLTLGGSKYVLDPPVVEAQAPLQQLQLVARPHLVTHSLLLKVEGVEAPSRELPRLHLTIARTLGGMRSVSWLRPRKEDGLLSVDLRAQERGEWYLLHEGYRGATGQLPESGASTEVQRAPMEPGWGLLLSVRDAETRRFVPGVRFQAGAQTWTTGPQGRVLMSLARRPERLFLDSEAWEVVPGQASLDAVSGAFRDQSSLTVYVRPKQL